MMMIIIINRHYLFPMKEDAQLVGDGAERMGSRLVEKAFVIVLFKWI
jgi:hypothetical protein